MKTYYCTNINLSCCSILYLLTKNPVKFLPNRYPNDVYDRYWTPLQFDDWIPITTNSTIYSHSDDNAYSIPDVVLRTAAKTQNASIPLNLYWTPPDSLSKCYVYFHFAEIEKLEAGQQRKLKINLNGERFLVESIKLDYLSPQTIVQNNPPISGKRLHFSIYAAEGTKLPPILNAVETAVLKELPNKPTAIDDGMLSSLFYHPCKDYAQFVATFYECETLQLLIQ